MRTLGTLWHNGFRVVIPEKLFHGQMGVDPSMVSNIENHGKQFRIVWYHETRGRQTYASRNEEWTSAAKDYLEAVGEHTVLRSMAVFDGEPPAFLDLVVTQAAVERTARKRIRTFGSVAHDLIDERERVGQINKATATQRRKQIDTKFADWLTRDIRTITQTMLLTKERELLTMTWERMTWGGKSVAARGTHTPGSVSTYLNFAVGVLHHAFAEGLIDVDPTDKCGYRRNPSIAVDANRVMTREVWAKVLGYSSPESRLIWETMAETGMRPNEALALRQEYVTVTGKRPNIDVRFAFDGNEARVLTLPKRLSMGSVEITPEFAAKLAPLVKARKRGEFVFTMDDAGTPWRLDYLRRYHWYPMIHAAMDDGVLETSHVPYDLRHSHASWLFQARVPIAAISARLRHKNIKTTLDTYIHVMPGDEVKVMDVLRAA